jgi:hypothetical protein
VPASGSREEEGRRPGKTPPGLRPAGPPDGGGDGRWGGRAAPPGRWHWQGASRLAKGPISGRQKAEERAQELAPGRVRLGLAQGWLQEAPRKTSRDPEKWVRNVSPVCQHVLSGMSETSPPARQGGREASYRLHDVQRDTPTPSPTAISECGAHHVSQPVTQAVSYWEHPGACYTCGTTQRWRSIYGAVVCRTCHPPADVALVAIWKGEA